MARNLTPLTMIVPVAGYSLVERIEGRLSDLLDWLMENLSKLDEAEITEIVAKAEEAYGYIAAGKPVKAAIAVAALYSLVKKALES